MPNAAERLEIVRSRIERARRRFGAPPAEVTLEGKDLAPSRMWSFHAGRPI